MKQKLCKLLLRCIGWRVDMTVPNLDKCVICVAPHTSNWDFIIGKLSYLSIGRDAGFLMKKEWFFFPIGAIFRAMGGVPVERAKRQDLTGQIVEMFNSHQKFCIAITPEGTRKRTPHWKKGFYYIALKANVPIVLAKFDYKKRLSSATKVFYPTGNYERDLELIKMHYRGVKGLHPEQFTLGDI